MRRSTRIYTGQELEFATLLVHHSITFNNSFKFVRPYFVRVSSMLEIRAIKYN
jgi:hypothetical protein